MKKYSVAQARERFADVLDEAERNGSVVIERRNVRYVIRPEGSVRRRRKRRPILESLDRAITEGQWQWTWAAGGMKFARRPQR